jgi:hypothetical protein
MWLRYGRAICRQSLYVKVSSLDNYFKHRHEFCMFERCDKLQHVKVALVF